MDLQLTGKRVLVTGSSAGIGKAIARTFADEGALVAITGRDARKIETVAKDIRAHTGRPVVSITADLSTDEGANALADGVTAALGALDILVNNHGVFFERGWWDTTPTDWADIYNLSAIEQQVIATFLPNSTGRLGRPSDVANVVALIASPLSDYVNGANYRVDGGSTTAIN